MDRYALGMDFGTLSVRALIVNADTGEEIAEATAAYDVLETALPTGDKLPDGFALALPSEYRRAMTDAVRRALARAGTPREAVIGIGLDCTSSTVLPVDVSGTPLCDLPAWRNNPHAYAKLWKHHGAYAQSVRMRETARARGEAWLKRTGGNVLCELMLPKALETAEKAEDVWAATARYLEMGDWLTYLLTGSEKKSACMAVCNALCHPTDGYPDRAYWNAVAPGIPPVTDKLAGEWIGLGRAVGALTPRMAGEMGLMPGTPVASSLMDSHASVIGSGADRAGDLVAVIGTSAVYMMNDTAARAIDGIYSCAWEGSVPDLYAYEGGQSCVGDGLNWFVENCVPGKVERAAAAEGISVHEWLTREAAALAPGESGVMALDWLNGARTPLMRQDLTCAVTGLRLGTTCAQMYRAALESCCFGARKVIDCYRRGGLTPKRFIAAGGISKKNPLFMQILSDVCGMYIQTCVSAQTGALGAAIVGASASGRCGTLSDCIRRMASGADRVYSPKNEEVYDSLYAKYCALYARASESDLCS